MRNFTIYLTLFLCLIASKIIAQDPSQNDGMASQTFETRAKIIADKIENITKEEKAALKAEIESVNKELEAGTITQAQADEKKLKFAEVRSQNIESRVGLAQDELKELVKQKVEGKIQEKDSSRTFTIRFDNKKNKAPKPESRTTSQIVFALGVNNVVTDNAVANSNFRYWGSHFYEFGFASSTRLFKDNNLLHGRYGLSLMYNNLRPTDNRYFQESGEETQLVTSPIKLDDSRFRNVYLVVPMHLEFDFSGKQVKNDKTIFKTHQSVRIGLGGYFGANLKSKQILDYEVDGNDVKERTKGSFNVNDFIYGVSTYIGYKDASIYLKYDINPLFKDNVVDQNNISLGIRWDWN